MKPYCFAHVMNQVNVLWYCGYSGGQQFNGDFGYCRIAPESARDVLVLEFTPITLLPGFNFN